MKDEAWTLRDVAIAVGLVSLLLAASAIAVWIIWNSPALLP